MVNLPPCLRESVGRLGADGLVHTNRPHEELELVPTVALNLHQSQNISIGCLANTGLPHLETGNASAERIIVMFQKQLSSGSWTVLERTLDGSWTVLEWTSDGSWKVLDGRVSRTIIGRFFERFLDGFFKAVQHFLDGSWQVFERLLDVS
jgi:hypothetical protein